jgi:hypothetical protein
MVQWHLVVVAGLCCEYHWQPHLLRLVAAAGFASCTSLHACAALHVRAALHAGVGCHCMSFPARVLQSVHIPSQAFRLAVCSCGACRAPWPLLLTLVMSAWGAKPRLFCVPWRVSSCQCKAVLVVMPFALWKECCSSSPACCACCKKHAQVAGACCFVGWRNWFRSHRVAPCCMSAGFVQCPVLLVWLRGASAADV